MFLFFIFEILIDYFMGSVRLYKHQDFLFGSVLVV